MKSLSLAILVAVFLLRWSFWKNEQSQVTQFCQKFSHQFHPVTFEGSPYLSEDGDLTLHAPLLYGGDQVTRFPGKVVVYGTSIRMESGRVMRISGPLRCSQVLHNPGVAEDGTLAFFRPEIRLNGNRVHIESVAHSRQFGLHGAVTRTSIALRHALIAGVQEHASLRALVIAVWTGSYEALPESLILLYRDLGLLPTLALSGQHVIIFSALLLSICHGGAWLFWRTRFRNSLRGLNHVQSAIPLFSACLLYLASGGLPSIKRTAAMVFAVSVLRWRGLYSSALQVCLSTLGLILLWSPDQMQSAGFLLSGIFTALTLALTYRNAPSQLGPGGTTPISASLQSLKKFFYVPLLVPFLGLPVNAFFFAKVPWVACVSQMTLGLLWDFFWIPLGFMLPALALLPGVIWRPLAAALDWSYARFVALQLEWLLPLSATALPVIRPTYLELFVVEGLMLWAVRWWISQKDREIAFLGSP